MTDQTFRELPPIVAPARPAPVVALDASGEVARAHRAPADGPRLLRAVIAGPRLVITPASPEAAKDLAAGRATAGTRYDHQARKRTHHLDRALRHGGVRIEDALLAAELAGLAVELDPTAARYIERRRRTHERQTRPIPRAIWRDDSEIAGDTPEIVADRALGGGSWRR